MTGENALHELGFMASASLERLRIYLGDERHIYKGSHQIRRRQALQDLERLAEHWNALMAEMEASE